MEVAVILSNGNGVKGHKATPRRTFHLGTEERPFVPDVMRVSSPGLSNAVQIVSDGRSALINGLLHALVHPQVNESDKLKAVTRSGYMSMAAKNLQQQQPSFHPTNQSLLGGKPEAHQSVTWKSLIASSNQKIRIDELETQHGEPEDIVKENFLMNSRGLQPVKGNPWPSMNLCFSVPSRGCWTSGLIGFMLCSTEGPAVDFKYLVSLTDINTDL
ncbi:hypothetical protein LINGRAHAP2_LOCUS17876 [Linum grandiflorum]